MFERIEDFAQEWIEELRLTGKVLDALTDESLSQAVAPGRRTLGQLAWHLVQSPHFMTHCGLAFEGPDRSEVPEKAAVLAEEYRRIGYALLDAVRTQWTEERLHDTVDLWGESWKNGASLRFTLMHQAHHRGQMTVLMRQAGLRVPDIYGPTYDTWIDRGMAPLA